MTTVTAPPSAASPATGKRPNAFVRLYRGETSFDFIGRRRWWYALSALVIVAGVVSLTTRGFNLGIDFKGGTEWVIPANGLSVDTVTKAVQAAGVPQPVVQELGTGGSATIQVQGDLSSLSAVQHTAVTNKVIDVLASLSHTSTTTVSDNVSDVGPTWGSQITKKAVIAVIVFFIVVVLYISFRFEWKMALAALIAVIHDLLVTAGIYSLFGFQVTPDTVIAILTILGYSLYDTVVVFDRIRESTRGLGASGRMTYEDVVNLSMNQVLARSINTSLVAILPVLSVLVIGAEILGASTLQYFGLALVIGLTSGAYSSIFIASPILTQLKEREPRYAAIRQKLANRDSRAGLLTPAAAAAMSGASDVTRRGAVRPAAKKQAGTIRPAARTQAARSQAARGQAVRTTQPAAKRAAAKSAAQTADLAAGDGAGTADGVATNGGAPDTDGQARTGTGPARAGGPRTQGTSAARRPPPRPRKGKGKGGKRR
ncbi:MAG: protein translocase subunit SecF [Acidimicrobiales bacterium]